MHTNPCLYCPPHRSRRVMVLEGYFISVAICVALFAGSSQADRPPGPNHNYNNNDASSGSSMASAAVAGIVIGVSFVILIIVVAVVCICRRRRQAAELMSRRIDDRSGHFPVAAAVTTNDGVLFLPGVEPMQQGGGPVVVVQAICLDSMPPAMHQPIDEEHRGDGSSSREPHAASIYPRSEYIQGGGRKEAFVEITGEQP